MGDSTEVIRGEVRTFGFRRVAHGVYLPSRDDLDAWQETMRDLRAWLCVLPDSAVFTHLTAAWLAGWWVPQLSEHVPVFAAVDLDSGRPRRPGLICSRLTREARPWTVQGLPLDRPAEILLRCARDLTLVDLVPLIDSALRLQHVTRTELQEIIDSRRPGIRRLRTALELAEPRSESRWETILRLFHVAVEIEFDVQVDLFDKLGTFVGRADLLVRDTVHVHEYDGAGHRDKATHRRDLRRERRFAGSPYLRSGFTADDLVNHPLVVLAEMDRLLERRHEPQRVRLWRTWIANSTLSSEGRKRLFGRWNHRSGTTDWSRTA